MLGSAPGTPTVTQSERKPSQKWTERGLDHSTIAKHHGVTQWDLLIKAFIPSCSCCLDLSWYFCAEFAHGLSSWNSAAIEMRILGPQGVSHMSHVPFVCPGSPARRNGWIGKLIASGSQAVESQLASLVTKAGLGYTRMIPIWMLGSRNAYSLACFLSQVRYRSQTS